MSTGIILFGHGSRDAKWREPMEAVARLIVQKQPDTDVSCAYLELCEPTLQVAADRMVHAGATSIKVFPLFLGVGKHAREDMPELVTQIRASHPGIGVELMPAAGEHPLLIELLASLALA